MFTMHEEQLESTNLRQALAQDEKQNEKKGSRLSDDYRVKFRRFVRSNGFDMFLKITFILLCIPHVISTVFFSIFDTWCSVYERASVSNCSQDFFVPHPRQWITAWLMISLISVGLFMFIIYLNHEELNFQRVQAREIYKKGSFGSLVFLLLASLIYYFIRLIPSQPDGTSKFISALLFLWMPLNAVLICCINYLPPVQLEIETKAKWYTRKWWSEVFAWKNSNFFVYWFALVVYFFELICKNAAIMLDVAQDVEPFIKNNFSAESYGQYSGLMVIIIGFRLAFHARLLTFFWEKIFHGDKDLFSEPGDKLVADAKESTEPARNYKLKERKEGIELPEIGLV